MDAPDFHADYAHLTNDELLVVAGDRSSLVPDAMVALETELRRRGLAQEGVSTAARCDQTGRTPEEWKKRRSYFRWVWAAFGALLALGTILMERCGR